MTYYAEAGRNQSSSTSSARVLAIAALSATTFLSPAQPDSEAVRTLDIVRQDERIISRIEEFAQKSELLDEGEPAPRQDVIAEATRLIREASSLMSGMPPGRVAAFFGEINVSWQSNDSIVRLACFPNSPTLIQVGRVSEPGSYRSEQNPTGALLARRLRSLVAQNDPEQPISG